MSGSLNALKMAHRFIRENVGQGDICIDATAGRGNDTLLLSQLVGDKGKVISFDIQEEAIASTKELLDENKSTGNVELVHKGHEHMNEYAEKGSVSCITFNLGWLPGGNHSVYTLPDTTLSAIKSGLELLKVGGIMSICIYYGRDMEDHEKNAVLEYLKTVDFKRYTVLVTDFTNRPNNPPIPVFITRDE